MNQRNVTTSKLIHFRQWKNKKYAVFCSLKKQIKICTLAAAYSIVAQPVHAQVKNEADTTRGEKVFDIDEVVVVSTNLGQKNAETGRSIQILNQKDIEQLPVRSIDELIRYLPGVEALSRNAFGVQTDFSIQGSNFNQVLVLIDGMKINDPLTAHFNSNLPVSLSEIDRIEVIHGPAAAEYGPDAVGGVINIITKTFSANKQYKSMIANGDLYSGQYNLLSTRQGVFVQDGIIRSGIGVMINKSDGQLLNTGLRSNFNLQTYSLSLAVQPAEHLSIAWRGAFDYRDFNAQRFYSSLTYDSATEKVERIWNQVKIEYSKDNHSTEINASLMATDDNYLFNPSSEAAINYTHTLNLQLKHTVAVSPTFKFLTGIQADQREITSNNRGDHTIWHDGIFASAFYKPIMQFNINVSLRCDYEAVYGLKILPQINVSYQAGPFIIRGSSGRSIRAADFTESYYNTMLPYPVPALSTIGNPFLNSEQSWSNEIGIDYKPVPWIILSATGFIRSSSNLIDYVKTLSNNIRNNQNLLDSTDYNYATNISKLTTSGIETQIRISRHFSDHLDLLFAGGYTLLADNEKVVSLYISSHARQMITNDLVVSYKKLRLGMNMLWKERNTEYSEALGVSLSSVYVVWNANLDFEVVKKTFYISLMAANIFNEQYYDILGAQMPGRWIMGGIKYNLGQ